MARPIQELAGHQDLSVTQRYMHLSPVALDDAIRLLDQPVRRRPASGAIRAVEIWAIGAVRRDSCPVAMSRRELRCA